MQKNKKFFTEIESESVTPRIFFTKNNLKEVYENIILYWKCTWKLDWAQKRINDIYNYIYNWLNSVNDINNFIEKIENLEFVVINCETDDDAYQLFEWLNSTGVSLWAVELVKNSILWRIKELDSAKVNDFFDKWNEIENKFEGIDKNIWLSKFIRQQFFWSYWYVNNSKLFKAIKVDKINDKSVSDLNNYIEELDNDSDTYIQLRNWEFNFYLLKWMPKDDGFEACKIISSIASLWLDQVYWLLLWLIKYWNWNIEYFRSSFIKHLNKIWAFLLIIKFTKISPAIYERLFANTCKSINRKDYKSFKNYMKDDFFDKLNEIINDSKNEFIKRFNEKIFWKKYWGITKHILKNIYWIKKEKITLEYIIPQDFSKWNCLKDENKKTINKSISRIDNFSLFRRKFK